MITGLILAGGKGQRLGGLRKGDLRLGNIALSARTIARLSPQVDEILLSIGHDVHREYENLCALPDSPDGVAGPAAGLLAGARWTSAQSGADFMLSVSVDTPCFPLDFARRAQSMLSTGIGCVVAAYGDRDYPTNALWHVPTLLDALNSEPAGRKGPRLRDVAKRVGVVMCRYDDHIANPFAGINTLPDLLALSRVLRDRDETAQMGVGKRNQIG